MTDAPPRPGRSRPVIESAVEPKFVERRRQVRAQAHRTRIRRWIALGVVAALIALSIGAVMSPLLDIDKITVGGASHLSQDAVVTLSGLARGDHLVSVDLDEVRSKLMADPWIASAKVAKKVPGTVDVRIIEEQPLLEFEASDGNLLISQTGRVLAAAGPGGSVSPESSEPGSDATLPTVTYEGSIATTPAAKGVDGLAGLVGQHLDGVFTDLTVLVKRLPADLMSQMSTVRVAKDKNVTLELVDDVKVKFGQPTDLEAKLVAVRAVRSQVVLDCMETIDVREPTRAAVSRGQGCPGISPELDDPADDSSSGKESGSAGSGDSGDTGDSNGSGSSGESESGG